MNKLFLLALVPAALRTFTEFELIIPTYNNEKYCIQNLQALVQQNYPHWHATIIVDCATDTTAQLITDYIDAYQLHDKFTVTVNETRCGALANIYHAAMACPPHKVIGLYDGDDWLAHDNVLQHIAHLI